MVKILLTPCSCMAASSQSPLRSVSADGENCSRSLAPPFPTETASLGFGGSPEGGVTMQEQGVSKILTINLNDMAKELKIK